jgi:cysteinyl-tRNA synthetase
MKLTNTLTGQKEEFKPLKQGEVSIYVCGVTLYDDIHVGHLKSIVAFEVMRNYFAQAGFSVKLVRNITDVDDKIIAKANSLGRDPLDLVNSYIEKFHELLKKMDIPPPDVEPRVTQYLTEIESYIADLVKEGKAYKARDAIYFDTQVNPQERYPLSKKIVKDLEDRTRLGQEAYDKKHKADFALWKEDAKYGFDSSIFNKQGRPGWHIECSVMHHHTLGKQFDIHGGGRDLIFPHHENEILQSVAHNGVNPANYWVHNGMMTKDGKKLSKSLGNSIYVKDLLNLYSPEALKLFLNKGQYNQSQEFNPVEIQEAHHRWKTFVEGIPLYVELSPYKSIWDDVIKALEDDFNTPLAVMHLYGALKDLQVNKSYDLAQEILKVSKLLSVVSYSKTLEDLYENSAKVIPQDIQDLLNERQKAKVDKNYAHSDAIRKILIAKGWEIKDSKEGVKITYKLGS